MAEYFRACSVVGCKGNAHYRAKGTRGWCQAHYLRWLRYGDPLNSSTRLGEPIEFIKNVALLYDGDDCLRWPFSTNDDGYGVFRIDGQRLIASRYVCELAHGEPPTPEHQAAHSCGKGHEACVSRKHLRWATPSENHMDRVEHDTHNRGSRHTLSKLTDDQVREIRALSGRMSRRETAARFGVSMSLIAKIRANRAWQWLD